MSNGSHAAPGFRPYCDTCGDKLWPEPVWIAQAREIARLHAITWGHGVRIEPWDSYALVEFFPGGVRNHRPDRPSDRL